MKGSYHQSGDLNSVTYSSVRGHCGVGIFWNSCFSNVVKQLDHMVHDCIYGIKISKQNGPNLYVLSVYLPHESCRIDKCDDVIMDLEKYVAALQPHGVVIVIEDINSHFGSECAPHLWGLTSRNGNIMIDFLRNNALECVDVTDLYTGPVYTFYKADLPKSFLDHCIISQSGVQHVNKCYI